MGWYRALVHQLVANITAIEAEQRSSRWRWLPEWQYVAIDVLRPRRADQRHRDRRELSSKAFVETLPRQPGRMR